LSLPVSASIAREAQERFYDGAAGDHLLVAWHGVTRAPAEDVVKIVLASGEGRTVRATCKFRGGKLFDVLRRAARTAAKKGPRRVRRRTLRRGEATSWRHPLTAR
jgi:hypothetical protein